MPPKWLHFRIEEELHDRVRDAAAAERRSVSNWVALACEKALDSDAQAVLEFLRETATVADHMDLIATTPGAPKTPFPSLWRRLLANQEAGETR